MVAFSEPAFDQLWGWPDLILDREWATDFHRRWTIHKGFTLYAIACRDDDVEAIRAETTPAATVPGYAPNGAMGIHIATIGQSIQLPIDTKIQGWEVAQVDPRFGFGRIAFEKSLARATDGLIATEASAISLARTSREPSNPNGSYGWYAFALCPLDVKPTT